MPEENKKEYNIKSTTIDNSLQLAKEFLGKLISPTAEEIGLLIADNIKYLRFKNQVRILLKAKKYVEDKDISTTEIPTKILVPLLEKSSLEEDENLQEKWVNLIVNMADSETNLKNQIFPYILSQISIEEYEGLEELEKKEFEFSELKVAYYKTKEDDQFTLKTENRKLKDEIDKIQQEGFWLNLNEYECENLKRLGVVRELPPRIYIEEFRTGGYEHEETWQELSAEYEEDIPGFRITELGSLFLDASRLKS